MLATIALGVALCHSIPGTGEGLKPVGYAFTTLVKMITTFVIFLTIATGIAGINDLPKVGRVAGKAMACFGRGGDIERGRIDVEAGARPPEQSVTGLLMNTVPSTIVGAVAEGDDILQLFFSVLFGIALVMTAEKGKPVVSRLQALIAPFFKLVSILLKAAPIGAFGAMVFTIGKYGVGSVMGLAMLAATFCAVLFVFIVLGAVCRCNGSSIFALIRSIEQELVLATFSLEARLPSLTEKMEKAGARSSAAGHPFNLDGTNISMTLAALFIAQATNTDLSIDDRILLLLVAMLPSKGAARMTGTGFVTLAATLFVVPTAPAVGMTLIHGVNQFMFECRMLRSLFSKAGRTLAIVRRGGGPDEVRSAEALASGPSSLWWWRVKSPRVLRGADGRRGGAQALWTGRQAIVEESSDHIGINRVSRLDAFQQMPGKRSKVRGPTPYARGTNAALPFLTAEPDPCLSQPPALSPRPNR
ncbi:C4-dicarboxylate transport protein [Mesorhizobium amorphae]|nr:C4-dicarboxylate transport protein [Mesorhizobium amorphae]